MRPKFTFLVLIAAVLAGCAGPTQHDSNVYYPYHYPINSPGAKFAGLPPAVQQSIRAEAGTAQMYDIRKMPVPGREIYQVLFVDEDAFPPLYVASDGSVLYPDLTVAIPAGANEIGASSGGRSRGLALGDVPVKVAETIHQNAPTGEVDYISKVTVGTKNYYEVTFKDPVNHPALYIADDGTLLESNTPGEH